MRPDMTPQAAQAPYRRRAKPVLTALVLALGLAMPHAAPAQTGQPGAEDLRALIYYLDHDDQRSVQAEMRRLRTQFPHWTPPGDVSQLRNMVQAPNASVDVQPIWARIQRNDYAGARALIADAQSRVPGWSPDAEMLRVLDTNESQAAFDEAYTRHDAAAALAAARRTPALMRCDRINNAWRLAELYHLAQQDANAVATYRGVLASCTRISDVVPTLEKANAVATWDQMGPLFTAARQAAPTNGERLDQVEARLRAGRGGRVARASGRQAPSAPRAPAAPRAAAPAVVAAAPASPLPPSQLPLRGDSRIAQTRRMKEQSNWPACVAASSNPRSIEVLYERSWCVYNMDRPGEALAGFTAVARTGAALGGNVTRDTRFGMILTYLAMNMTEEAARLAADTNLTRQQRIDTESVILDQRGVRAYHLRDYAQSIAYLNALEQLKGSLRRDLSMLRAYAYVNVGDRQRAMAEFTRLDNELSTEETRTALQQLHITMGSG